VDTSVYLGSTPCDLSFAEPEKSEGGSGGGRVNSGLVSESIIETFSQSILCCMFHACVATDLRVLYYWRMGENITILKLHAVLYNASCNALCVPSERVLTIIILLR